MNHKPTAADHFAAAERLLDSAQKVPGPEMQLSCATRAQAHLDAARLLWNMQRARYSTDSAALNKAGLSGLAEEREAR